MALTLQTAIDQSNPLAEAIIVPSKSKALTVRYSDLQSDVAAFQRKLADLGITKAAPVSIALVNSYEFIVSFLAASWQRGIAAPLNPAYKQDEFEFYIQDVKSAIVLVPQGAWDAGAPSVKAAKKFNAAVAECYWDAVKGEVALDVKDYGLLKGKKEQVLTAEPDDVALILHTRLVSYRICDALITNKSIVALHHAPRW
jgi:long-subunit acyl-CoA synthetase (AMP-forming)